MKNQLIFFEEFISHRGFDSFKKEFTSTHIPMEDLQWIKKIEYHDLEEIRVVTYTDDFWMEFQYEDISAVRVFSDDLKDKINIETKNCIKNIDDFLNSLSIDDAKLESILLLKKTEKLLRQLSNYNEAYRYTSIREALIFIKHFLIIDSEDDLVVLKEEKTNSKSDKTKKNSWLKLIAEAKIKELVDELVEFGIEKHEDDLLLISNRWYTLQNDVQNGVIKRDDYDLENNKITKSLISFVRELKITE
jgi:Effector-associated domain 11